MPGSQPEPSQRSQATGRRIVDGRGGAERGLRELEVDDRLGVGRARRAGLSALPNGSPPKNASKMSPKPNASPPGRPAAATGTRAVFAEHVVATAALGILQRLVGDVDLLELRLGLGIGVAVGVVLARQRAVRRA